MKTKFTYRGFKDFWNRVWFITKAIIYSFWCLFKITLFGKM